MRTLWPVLAAALGVALAGCSGHDTPTPAPSAQPTSIGQLDSSTMRVVRVAFCDLIPQTAIHAALEAEPDRARSWHNGDRLSDAAGEIGHEFGCAWFGPQGRVARAWVFARPVTRGFARTVIRSAEADPGCHAALTPGFGDPALAQTCVRKGHSVRIRRAGLFGDTWLTCEVSGHGKPAALHLRTDAWCVSVATALNAGQPTS
jgi:hypothetical protein